MTARFDHLVFTTPDLGAAVTDLAARGVVLSAGGAHVGLGTRNLLADLGDGGYLEVVGPDRDQDEPVRPRMFGIDTRSGSGVVTWAVRVDDVDAAVERARAAGYDPGSPVSMSRRRADGVLLTWRLAVPDLGTDVVPFLIEWGDTPHPSTSAVRGARLVSLVATHPDPDLIRRRLDALGVELDVVAGVRPTLSALIDTAEGEVVLPCA
ncbi:MAG: VOC family protein [Actinomycetota bacterium]|nr:VOC family protein [Actinomycetota bacterium]